MAIMALICASKSIPKNSLHLLDLQGMTRNLDLASIASMLREYLKILPQSNLMKEFQ